jgi:hypothetical protein
MSGLPYYGGWFGPPLPDLLTANDAHLVVGHPTWLIKPESYPAHEALRPRCAELLQMLQPVAMIREQVESFRTRHFRRTVIGVHLRRGDHLRSRPDMTGNTASALAEVDRLLTLLPDAGIFLSTDDGAVHQHTGELRREGVKELFAAHYGERLCFTTPRSLDRREPAAIQDALVDLLLLRQTDAFVGTLSSSFSEMAIFGRVVPAALLGVPLPGYRRVQWLSQVTGLAALLRVLGRWQTGRRDLPLPTLQRYYTRLPFYVVRWTLKNHILPAYRRMRDVIHQPPSWHTHPD